jgi:cell division transport system permease protein
MKYQETAVLKRRLRSSYIISVISISLVLFLVGLLGILILHTKKITDSYKENFGFTLFLKEDAREADIMRLQKNLDALRYVKSTEYIDKDKAAKEFQKDLGEDFVDFLGYNPLPSSIEVKLYASYTNPDSIATIEKVLQSYEQISEVFYQKVKIQKVNENVRIISFVTLVLVVVLFIVAVSLINNTIRLAIYARRFIIKTMQLVGATRSFIRRPFLYKSILQGFIGASIANTLIILFLFWIEKQLKGMIVLTEFNYVFIPCIIILLIGIVINYISTYFAVNKYLHLHPDELYY